ncbi:FHA domain-containing protein [Nesterenkonia alkaliphila]|uniref:FHA domain-containing protein n=1 Tax=Nesterenkonia alkaliphila TaxID=1463631 RepID=A0A7K1UE73_9MICC|nr:FHA domain-containing protein [Nesterenkonia alkaliphila]MVT24783.1 FHA domain-containing protein [Nesterenkonia alkaliphila]GFZ95905.1 hypothetical protein GCM10011359_26720 [Nesterenkonia alkaliphila]
MSIEKHHEHDVAPESASETTSIALPPAHTGPLEAHLSDQDSAAIGALPRGSALLIAHTGANQGARFLLDQDETTVGRHPEADVFLDDVTVSRRHVKILRTEAGFQIQDLGSLNGTYVNHDRVDAHLLSAGDEVQVGKFRLTFYAGGS